MIFEDQLAALAADSKKVGTRGGEIDFALLVDGLSAEREQGITIDVAYRFFSTEKRKFIVADTPGHEQYTRNMVTGASTADLAVILIDARKGVLTQTRRHSYLVSLLGIRRVVLGHQQDGPRRLFGDVFARIERRLSATFAGQIGLTDITCIPDLAPSTATTSCAAEREYALVHGPNAAGAPRERARRGRAAREAVSAAGAVGEPAESRIPGLRRLDRQRRRASR